MKLTETKKTLLKDLVDWTCEMCHRESRNLHIHHINRKIEVESKLHTEMNMFSEIKIPNGMRLLTLAEWLHIYNNYFDKFNFKPVDEVVKQPIKEKENEYPYWNVWFRNLVYQSELRGRYLGDGDRMR